MVRKSAAIQNVVVVILHAQTPPHWHNPSTAKMHAEVRMIEQNAGGEVDGVRNSRSRRGEFDAFAPTPKQDALEIFNRPVQVCHHEASIVGIDRCVSGGSLSREEAVHDSCPNRGFRLRQHERQRTQRPNRTEELRPWFVGPPLGHQRFCDTEGLCIGDEEPISSANISAGATQPLQEGRGKAASPNRQVFMSKLRSANRSEDPQSRASLGQRFGPRTLEFNPGKPRDTILKNAGAGPSMTGVKDGGFRPRPDRSYPGLQLVVGQQAIGQGDAVLVSMTTEIQDDVGRRGPRKRTELPKHGGLCRLSTAKKQRVFRNGTASAAGQCPGDLDGVALGEA